MTAEQILTYYRSITLKQGGTSPVSLCRLLNLWVNLNEEGQNGVHISMTDQIAHKRYLVDVSGAHIK